MTPDLETARTYAYGLPAAQRGEDALAATSTDRPTARPRAQREEGSEPARPGGIDGLGGESGLN